MTSRIEHSPLTVMGKLCARIDAYDRYVTRHERQIRRVRLGVHALWITAWAATALILAAKEGVNLYEQNTVGIDSDSFRAAYKAIGGKGPVTYKALRSLPDTGE